MLRKAFGLFLTVSISLSWAPPLRAETVKPSHACCAGGEVPKPVQGQLPACCRAPDALPPTVAAAVSAPAPVHLPSAVIAVDTPAVARLAPPRFVPAAAQAPPGTHSGLSPPASGL